MPRVGSPNSNVRGRLMRALARTARSRRVRAASSETLAKNAVSPIIGLNTAPAEKLDRREVEIERAKRFDLALPFVQSTRAAPWSVNDLRKRKLLENISGEAVGLGRQQIFGCLADSPSNSRLSYCRPMAPIADRAESFMDRLDPGLPIPCC